MALELEMFLFKYGLTSPLTRGVNLCNLLNSSESLSSHTERSDWIIVIIRAYLNIFMLLLAQIGAQ